METPSELHLLLESLNCYNEKISSDEDFFEKIREHAKTFRENSRVQDVFDRMSNGDEDFSTEIKNKVEEFCNKIREDKEIMNKITEKSDFVALLKAKIIMSKKKKEAFALSQFDKEELEVLIDAVDAYQFKTFHENGNIFRTELLTEFFERAFSDAEVEKTGKTKVEIIAMFKSKHGKTTADYKFIRESISLLKTKLILTMQNKTIDQLFDSAV